MNSRALICGTKAKPADTSPARVSPRVGTSPATPPDLTTFFLHLKNRINLQVLVIKSSGRKTANDD